jgi:hypothetical protein
MKDSPGEWSGSLVAPTPTSPIDAEPGKINGRVNIRDLNEIKSTFAEERPRERLVTLNPLSIMLIAQEDECRRGG